MKGFCGRLVESEDTLEAVACEMIELRSSMSVKAGKVLNNTDDSDDRCSMSVVEVIVGTGVGVVGVLATALLVADTRICDVGIDAVDDSISIVEVEIMLLLPILGVVSDNVGEVASAGNDVVNKSDLAVAEIRTTSDVIVRIGSEVDMELLERIPDLLERYDTSVDKLTRDVRSTIVEDMTPSEVISLNEEESDGIEDLDDFCSVAELEDATMLVLIELEVNGTLLSLLGSLEMEADPVADSVGIGADDAVDPKVITIVGVSMVEVWDASEDTTTLKIVAALEVDSIILDALVWF